MKSVKFQALLILIGLFLSTLVLARDIAYVNIHSSGTIVWAIRHLDIYRSEFREVAVSTEDTIYYDGGYGNWTLICQTLAEYNITGITGAFLYSYKAAYPSQYVVGSWTGRDELALAINVTRMYNLDLRVAFGVLYASPSYEYPPDEWKCKDENGVVQERFLDPTNPNTRQHILNLTRELVTKYEFEWLCLDYIRYDGPNMPYTDTAKQMFSEYLEENITDWSPFYPNGSRYGEFLQWRMIPINTLVKEIYDLAKSIRPNLQIAAYTRQWWNMYMVLCEIGQDVAAWVKGGYIDRVIPMTYVGTTTAVNTSISNYLAYAVAGPKGAVPITPILAIRLFDENQTLLTPTQFAELVATVRNLGCEGFSINRYGGPGENPNNPDPLPDIRDYLRVLNLTETWKLYDVTFQYLNESSVQISWKTTKPTTGRIEYNSTKLFDATLKYHPPDWYPSLYYWDMEHYAGIIVEDPTPKTAHQLTLTNLQKNKIYYFRVQSGDSIYLVTTVYTIKI